jgi:hypothetical protein
MLSGLCLALLAGCGDGRPSDDDIRFRIIEESMAAFPGKCPCPQSLLNSGKRCGKNSAYSKKGGGARPKCYPSDVSDAQVKRYREESRIEGTN